MRYHAGFKSSANISGTAVKVPGTELVVVSHDGALEQGKRVLYSLSRCPDPFGQLLAVVSSRMFLLGDETQVGGIAIGDHFFGVLCEFGIQHRLDGLEAALGHRLQMNPSMAFGHSNHHCFRGLGHLGALMAKAASDVGFIDLHGDVGVSS